MNTVFVFGSNSPTGSHIVNHLLEHTSAEVVGISRSDEYPSFLLPYLYKRERSSRFSFYKLDINTDVERIHVLIRERRPEVIINLAAQGEVQHSFDHPEDWFITNAVGIVRLANPLRDASFLKKFVQVSTPEIYGTCDDGMRESTTYYDPSTPYAASKAAGDMFLLTLHKAFRFPLVIVRSTNVYGIHQQLYRIIPRTIIYLKSGKTIELHGGGHAVKSFIHFRDVAEGIWAAAEKGLPGSVYHFSPPEGGRKVRDVVKMICELRGVHFEDVTVDVGERRGQDKAYVIDSKKAKNELGWHPSVSFKEGLREMASWIDDSWDEVQSSSLAYVHLRS